MSEAWYKGYSCYQTATFAVPFNKLFQTTQFSTIIEIGTAKGGLAVYLADNNSHSVVHTFDIKRRYRGDFARANLVQHWDNVFEKSEFLEALITACNGGSVLLLCDGGDKKREVQMFAPMLKPYDVLMVHDYREDQKEETGWPCEITRSDLPQGFVEHMLYDMFRATAWGCFTKI